MMKPVRCLKAAVMDRDGNLYEVGKAANDEYRLEMETCKMVERLPVVNRDGNL